MQCIGTQNNLSQRKMAVAHKINLWHNKSFHYYDLLQAMVSQIQYLQKLKFRFGGT